MITYCVCNTHLFQFYHQTMHRNIAFYLSITLREPKKNIKTVFQSGCYGEILYFIVDLV